MSHSFKKKTFLNLKLPFFTGVIDEKKVNFPKKLTFSLFLDEQLLIPKLILNKEIIKSLKIAYSNGSMLSTPLGESNLANIRLKEFVNNLNKHIKNKKKLIEIGCGNGELLNVFKNLGYDTLGFEIGPQFSNGIKKYNLKILQEQFHPRYLNEKADCIFSSGCLEHIIDPIDLIDKAYDSLNNKGIFFGSVPNSEIHFKTGSIEELCYQHVNYFTPTNIIRLLKSRGFVRCNFKLTKAGNEFYFWGKKSSNGERERKTLLKKDYHLEVNALQSYEKKIEIFWYPKVKYLDNLINKKKKRVGFYAGGYVMASMLKNSQNVFFFDGDEFKWGKKWLPNLREIESPLSIKKRNLDLIIVFKQHYYDEIKKTLVSQNNINNDKIINFNKL